MSIETVTKLATQTVGAGGTASVTFSNIPQNYTDLKIVISARKSDSTTISSSYMTFNGSTSGYSCRRIFGNGGSTSSDTSPTGTSSMYIGSTNSATSTAGVFSNAEIYIPSYTGGAYKSASIDMIQEDNSSAGYQFIITGLWANNAPITSITFTGDANYVQYSTFTLYGVKSLRSIATAPTVINNGVYLYTTAPIWAGYLYGGSNGTANISTINKLTFGLDTYSTLSATTPTANNTGAGSANSGVAGYNYGGYTTTYVNAISKLTFAGESTSMLSATLTNTVYGNGSFSDSGTAGYSVAGFNGTGMIGAIDKLTYSSETVSSTGKSIANVYCLTSSGFSNKGYAGYTTDGYGWGITFINTVYKYAFSTTTVSTPTTYVGSEYNVVSWSNEGTAGYSAGGGDDMLNNIAKMPYSTDTMSNLSATLSAGKDWGAGLGDKGSAGYFCLGRSSRTDTDKLSFSTDTKSTIAAVLSSAYAMSSISNNGVL